MLGLNLSLLTVAIRKALAVWTPATLFANNEQGVWYDPSDFSTLFQDSAGTTPVTAVGQPVGRILDKSGRGNHATQAAGTARPVLQQDGNGKYYLAFDGVDDGMVAPFPMGGTNVITIVYGVRPSLLSGVSYTGLLGNPGGTTSDYRFMIYTPDGVWSIENPEAYDRWHGFYIYEAEGDEFLNVAVTYGPEYGADKTVVVSTVLQPALGEVRPQINQNAIAPVFTGTAGTATGFATTDLQIGNFDGPFKGSLYSLIVRGALSDAAQVAAAEAYVAGKAGVTL